MRPVAVEKKKILAARRVLSARGRARTPLVCAPRSGDSVARAARRANGKGQPVEGGERRLRDEVAFSARSTWEVLPPRSILLSKRGLVAGVR